MKTTMRDPCQRRGRYIQKRVVNGTLQQLIHVQARDSDDEDGDEKMQDEEDDGG